MSKAKDAGAMLTAAMPGKKSNGNRYETEAERVAARHEVRRRSREKHGAEWYAAQKLRRLAKRKPRQLIGRKQSLRNYYARNKPKWTAWRDKRNRQLAQASPAWVDLKAVERVYALAAQMSFVFGEAYEVDHIVPLSHPLVCGLHCEANLQVLKSIDNKRKGNRWWPGMTEVVFAA